MGLLAAGVTPLLVPYTSVVTWYRFLVGAAPLSVPLAVKAVSNPGKREALAVLSLLILVPGAVYLHPNGSYYTSMLTGAYREFAHSMVPCPSSGSEQEAILGAAPVAASFVGAKQAVDVAGGGGEDEAVAGRKIPLVVYGDDARFVHLFVRNPDPKEFVWLDYVDGWHVNATMNRLRVSQVLLFTRMSISSVNQSVNSFSYVGPMQCFKVSMVSEAGSKYSVLLISRNK
ncbi:MAG: hypothetical protein ABC588_05070 [Candidatus Methanosuratincola petrocarbonis]